MMLAFGRSVRPHRICRRAISNLLMSPFPRPYPRIVLAAALAAGAACAAHAQEPQAAASAPEPHPAPSPARADAVRDQTARTRMSESVRRYGRENQGGRVLGVDSIRLNNRNLNRVKMVDDRGRVHVRVFDPQQSPPSARVPESMPPRTLTDGD